jgi:hypothetical protein
LAQYGLDNFHVDVAHPTDVAKIRILVPCLILAEVSTIYGPQLTFHREQRSVYRTRTASQDTLGQQLRRPSLVIGAKPSLASFHIQAALNDKCAEELTSTFREVLIGTGTVYGELIYLILSKLCVNLVHTANKLVLNLDKTNIMKFITNNSPHCALRIDYTGKYIEENKHKVSWFTN